MSVKAFISYSHRDEALVARLKVHLAQLTREGDISHWQDRKILAGGTVDDEIAANLEDAELFLAIASPDFLASEYCYDKEMLRALEKHAAGEMRVIPIIIEPCDWVESPLGRLKALPKDGKPVTEWANANSASGCNLGFVDRRYGSRTLNAGATDVVEGSRSGGAEGD